MRIKKKKKKREKKVRVVYVMTQGIKHSCRTLRSLSLLLASLLLFVVKVVVIVFHRPRRRKKKKGNCSKYYHTKVFQANNNDENRNRLSENITQERYRMIYINPWINDRSDWKEFTQKQMTHRFLNFFDIYLLLL